MNYKIGIIITFLLLVGTLAGAAQTCDPSLWLHIYHGRFKTAQDRLTVIEPCVTITGTFVHAKAEADGDFHVTIKLDPQFVFMLNEFNVSGQHGLFVVEPICENTVTQSDTRREKVCDNFHQTFKMSKKGTRVSVTGVLVTDVKHKWAELHPISAMQEIK